MRYLARRISPPKWGHRDYTQPNDVRADALGEIRTTDDALSVWKCNADRNDVQEIALALATPNERKDRQPPSQLSRMFILLLEIADLESDKLQLVIQPSEEGALTAVDDLRTRHFHLSYLNATKLYNLSLHMAKTFRMDAAIDQGLLHDFTKRELLDLVDSAERKGRLNLDVLAAPIRQQLEEHRQRKR